MNDSSKPTGLLDRLKSWWQPVIFFISAVTAVVQFLKLWRGDRAIVTWVTAALGWLALVVLSGYVAWWRVPSPFDAKRHIPAYPRWRRFALAGFVLLLLTPAAAGYALYWQDQTLSSKVVIMVADFTGPEPEQYRLTEQVLVQLREALTGYDDTVVVALGQPITEQEGSAVAREEGRRYRADLVLWGWYARTESDALVTVHVENLSGPDLLILEEHEAYQMQAPVAELESFQLQHRVSGEMRALILLVTGLARYEARDLREATQRFTEALAPGVWPDGMIGLEILYSYRGAAYLYRGEYERAVADYQLALSISQEVGDRTGEKMTLNSIGLVYHALGDHEQALEYYRQAVAISREIGDRAGEATTLNSIGLVYHALGDYEQALEYYQQALVLSQETGDQHSEGASLNNLGNIYIVLGDYEQAIAVFTEVLRLNPRSAQTYFSRGAAYHHIGQGEQAIADFRRVLELSDDPTLRQRAEGQLRELNVEP